MLVHVLGMIEPDTYPTEERELENRVKLSRYGIQRKHELDYEEALIKEKEYVSCS